MFTLFFLGVRQVSEFIWLFLTFPPFSAGGDDTTQTDSVLESFEYFHEKGKEKEDDLHKSYNDRSYLSSEDLGPGESRTGERRHTDAPYRAQSAVF